MGQFPLNKSQLLGKLRSQSLSTLYSAQFRHAKETAGDKKEQDDDTVFKVKDMTGLINVARI